MAREAVLEGSAMAGMLEYTLREKGLKLRDLPDIDPSLFRGRSFRNAHAQEGAAVHQGFADVSLLWRSSVFHVCFAPVDGRF